MLATWIFWLSRVGTVTEHQRSVRCTFTCWLLLIVCLISVQVAFRVCEDIPLERFFYGRVFSYLFAGVVLVSYTRFHKKLALAALYLVVVLYNYYLFSGHAKIEAFHYGLALMLAVLLVEIVTRAQRGWPLAKSDFP